MANSLAYKRLLHKQKVQEVIDAREFYDKKLAKEPTMPRYNHCLAAMTAAAGEMEVSSNLYRKALAYDENNISLRSDMSLHLSKVGRQQEAIDSMKKALMFHPHHGMLHKNLAGIYATKGRYDEAQSHAIQALYADTDDAMNHRNAAQIYEMTGDSRKSLIHNVKSINMEMAQGNRNPNTQAYRRAARQTVIRGGKIEDGVALISAARRVEGKLFESDTTNRTNEIIAQIAKRRGNIAAEMARAEEALKKKKDIEDAIKGGDVSQLLPDTHAVIRGPIRPLPEGRKKKHRHKHTDEEQEEEKEREREKESHKHKHKHKDKHKEGEGKS